MAKTTAVSRIETTSPSFSNTQVVVRTLNNPEGIKHFLANIPKTVEQAIERPAVSALIHSGVKKNMVEACLAAEIMRIANMLAVGGNLKEGQALEIAIQLLSDFPNESLEDFCLCLRRGIKGIYGQIFRFDILVINEWFQKYLDEKYKAIENKLMDEKDRMYEPLVPNFTPAETLTDEARRQKEKERMASWLDAVRAVDTRKIPPLTDSDIKKEGQDRPKPNPHPVTTASQIQKAELHREYIRQNYDLYTADKLPTWQPEDVWLTSLTEEEKNKINKIL